MIVALRDPSGQEYRLGIAEGRFVEPDAVGGPIRDLRHLVALTGLADCHAHLSGDGVSEMVKYDGSGLSKKMLRNARRQMAAGVLLLAEKGSKTSLTLRFLTVDEWERPQLQMAGRMIAVPGGYYEEFAAEVVSGNLDSVIAEAVEGGASWVKLARAAFGELIADKGSVLLALGVAQEDEPGADECQRNREGSRTDG